MIFSWPVLIRGRKDQVRTPGKLGNFVRLHLIVVWGETDLCTVPVVSVQGGISCGTALDQFTTQGVTGVVTYNGWPTL